jgi:Flp pilus assembly protein TadD
MIHATKGEHNEAIFDYTQAIRLSPQYARAYFLRGVAYHEKGDPSEMAKAEEDFTQAKKLGYKEK